MFNCTLKMYLNRVLSCGITLFILQNVWHLNQAKFRNNRSNLKCNQKKVKSLAFISVFSYFIKY